MVKILKYIRNPRYFLKRILFNLKNPIYKKSINKTNFNRIYNFHIKKCGGTSFNRAFTTYIDGDENNYLKVAQAPQNKITINNLPIVGWNIGQLKRGSFWYGFSHTNFDKLFPLKNKTFTFTFLRDPYKRTISQYSMMKEMQSSNPNHRASEKERMWLGSSFEEFLDNTPREHIQTQLYMFDSNFNVTTALENIKQINYVGIQGYHEEKFLKFLNEYFKINLNYRHARKATFKYKPTELENKLLMSKLTEEYKFFEEVKNLVGLNLN
tara:strand:- start:1226 stop:2026 length:801 start_codon:yes stop_codon:yes gene_type:complete